MAPPLKRSLHIPPTSLRRVVLTGFMGAGKSTVGLLVAEALGWRFLDIDRAMEQVHQASVPELFERLGEGGFRALEAEAIRAALAQQDAVVLALGGGALEAASTRALLHGAKGTRIFFLQTPLAVAVARCEGQNGGTDRPVLRDREALTVRYAARQEHYRQAHWTISTERRTAADVASLVLAALSSAQLDADQTDAAL